MYQTFLGPPTASRRTTSAIRVRAKDLRYVAKQYLLAPRLAISYFPSSHARLTKRARPLCFTRAEADASFTCPPVATSTLGNGLKLHVVERRESAQGRRRASGEAWGDRRSPPRSGLASMTAEMLEEGTATRTSLQIEAELDRVGSHLSRAEAASGARSRSTSLTRHLPESLELMADVLLHPSFPGEELERLRKQRLDGILQERVSPGAIAGKAVRKSLFGRTHPYGWPMVGEEASVREMSAPSSSSST